MHGGIAKPGEKKDAPESHDATILSIPSKSDGFGPECIELIPAGRSELFEGNDAASEKNEHHPRSGDIGEFGDGVVAEGGDHGDDGSHGEGDDDEG